MSTGGGKTGGGKTGGGKTGGGKTGGGKTGGGKTGDKKGGKGVAGSVLPNSAPVAIKTTAGIARGLLQALSVGKPFTGPGVNPLIRAISQAVIVSGPALTKSWPR
jgi:hypothetical protein